MSMKPITLGNLSRTIEKLKEYFLQIKDSVKTVNYTEPDEEGNIDIPRVDFAGELESSATQHSNDEFIARTSGGGASISDGDAWLTLIRGKSNHTGIVEEVLTWTITPSREDQITIEIDRDIFVAYVDASGTITLTFTTEWSANLSNYGITVNGTPTSGDTITISYTKANLGTITNATPLTFVSTGWNLYNHNETTARVVRYSDDFGYKITGTYTSIQFSETNSGTIVKEPITVDADGNFNPRADGYIWVTGGNSTDTAIYLTWSDWTEDDGPSTFSGYDVKTISFAALMTGQDPVFPYGLCQVGSARDEINMTLGTASRWIDRMANTEENMATAIASGREYDADEDFIYLVRATPDTTAISIDGSYTVSDHGIEYFTGSSLPVYAQTIYGASLKNKLERDTLTISQQTLTAAQKSQVQQNLGLSIANNLTTSTAGSVLDARQGKLLKDKTVDMIRSDTYSATQFSIPNVAPGSIIVAVRSTYYSLNLLGASSMVAIAENTSPITFISYTDNTLTLERNGGSSVRVTVISPMI